MKLRRSKGNPVQVKKMSAYTGDLGITEKHQEGQASRAAHADYRDLIAYS